MFSLYQIVFQKRNHRANLHLHSIVFVSENWYLNENVLLLKNIALYCALPVMTRDLGLHVLSKRPGARFYTTKGRDRFHWAATPLKPYKVGNICYMTYRYSVLYFLNLSLKHFFPQRKRQFLWKYPNPETVIVPCLNVSRMPNRRTSQSKIEDIVHCKGISLLN